MFCQKCGLQITNNNSTNFCNRCGVSLNNQQQQQAPHPTNQYQGYQQGYHSPIQTGNPSASYTVGAVICIILGIASMIGSFFIAERIIMSNRPRIGTIVIGPHPTPSEIFSKLFSSYAIVFTIIGAILVIVSIVLFAQAASVNKRHNKF